MTKFPAVTGKAVIAALCKAGWVIRDHRGSHVKMVKAGAKYPIIVPVHGSETIPKGTLRNIIRATGLTTEEFVELL
jgi:predicted RNA binding protein YcfA (HicA-like mRNA interferase family)